MFFKDIVGQQEVKNHLMGFVKQSRIAHALMISGAAGVGELPLALAYAQYVHCTNKQEGDACGQCTSCHKHSKLIHPDLHFVFPIAKSDKFCDDFLKDFRAALLENPYLTREQWMAKLDAPNAPGIIYSGESDKITKKLNQKSFESDYKIMIFWLPERMHEAAANKLLKIIEEPFPETLLLLVSNRPEEVLGTILSRTQPLTVKPIDATDLAAALKEHFAMDDDNARMISSLSAGSYSAAMEIISVSEEAKAHFDLFVEMMRSAFSGDVKRMKSWCEQVATIGRERQRNLLLYMSRMVRENFMYNFREPKLSYFNQHEKEFAHRFSPYINEKNVYEFMELLSLSEQHIGQNVNAKMVFFALALQSAVCLKRR